MGRTLASGAAAAVCVLVLIACSGKIDPTATGGGNGTAGTTGGTSRPGGGGSSNDDDNDPSFEDGDRDFPGGPSGSGSAPGSGGAGGGECFVTDLGPSCSKEAAGAICSSKGYSLTTISTTPTGCSATCCKDSPVPPGTPPANPCFYDAVGDGSTCLAYPDLMNAAVARCEARGYLLQTLSTANDCPGGATIAKVQCCVAGPKK